MGQEQISSDVFQVGKRLKNPKKFPGLKDIVTEQRREQEREREALRREIGDAEKQTVQYMQLARETLKGENYRGIPLEVVAFPGKKNAFSIGNSVGAIVISIDQTDDEDDELERKDSLKKDGDFSHTDITGTLILPTGGKLLVSEGENLESVIKTSAEFLKQAERIKHPENFGYKKVFFKKNDYGMVKLMGISFSGKEFMIPFFGKNSFSMSHNAPSDLFNRESYELILKYLSIPEAEAL